MIPSHGPCRVACFRILCADHRLVTLSLSTLLAGGGSQDIHCRIAS